jgi:hypothetical protein
VLDHGSSNRWNLHSDQPGAIVSGSKIYCQIVEIPMGIACASLLLLLSYGTELQVKLHTELDA